MEKCPGLSLGPHLSSVHQQTSSCYMACCLKALLQALECHCTCVRRAQGRPDVLKNLASKSGPHKDWWGGGLVYNQPPAPFPVEWITLGVCSIPVPRVSPVDYHPVTQRGSCLDQQSSQVAASLLRLTSSLLHCIFTS